MDVNHKNPNVTKIDILHYDLKRYSTIRDYLILSLNNINITINRINCSIKEEKIKNEKKR